MLDCQRVEIRTLKHSHVASDITNFTSAVCAVVTEMSSFGEPIFETWANTYSGDLYETFTTVNTYSSFWLQTDDYDVNNFVYSNSANILQSNNTVNNTSANWNSVYNSFNVTSAGFLTEVTADVRYVNISGDTMTGGLSSPSLSTNSLYVAGSTINFFDQTGSVIETLKSNDVRDFKSNYTLTNSHSANWDSVYSSFSSQSANNSSVYNTVQSNSSTTWNYQGSDIKSLTSNWENTYSDFSVQSGNNISVYNSFNSNSSNYNSVYNTVNSNSATTWNYQGSDIKSLTSNWQDTYSNFSFQSGDNTSVYNTVQDYSALWIVDNTIDLGVRALTSNWEDTYNTVQSNSSTTWNYQGTDIKSLTSDWEDAYNTVQSNSSLWIIDNSIDIGVRALTSNWENTYATVQSNSATTWNYQGTDLKSLSSNWENTYNTVQINSAAWIIDNSIDLGVRALTGNWQDTYVNFSVQSANNTAVYNTVNSNSALWIGGEGGDAEVNSFVYTNSANILQVDTNVNNNSGNWNYSYNTILTGGIIGGNTSVSGNLSAWTADINYIDFNSTIAAPTYQEGRLFYDNVDHTLSLYVDNPNVTLNIGQELWVLGVNKTGSIIPNATVVYLSGAQGNRPKMWPALADSDLGSADTIGLTTHEVAINQEGYITTEGIVSNVNTSSFVEGQVLYLSPTIPGGITNVKPVAPQHLVKIGYALNATNNGKIFVTIDNGYEIDELHNVKVTNVQNSDILKYNSLSSIWVNGSEYNGSDIKSLTGNWENTYTNFSIQSSNNLSVYNNVYTNSAYWQATTGGGGGGIIYYFNQATLAQSPTTNIPITAHQLGRAGLSAQTIYTSPDISQVSYSLVAGFLTDVLDPNTTVIPAGVWDFNVWGYSNANINNPTVLQAVVYTYDGVNAPVLISTSDDTTLTDSGIFIQHAMSCLIPQTSISLTDRIYVEFRAKASAGLKTVTLAFGDATPSHLHTTLPSVGGTGLVKVVDGVLQSPASLLVDADVASGANISQSKINGLTDIANKTNSTYNTVNSNSATTWNYQGADLKSLSGNWENTYNSVNNNSAFWNSVYNTVNSNSAINWNYQGTDIKSLTSNWQSTYISFQSQSANNALVFTNVNSNSANWNSSYTTVNLNSAITWNYQGTDLKVLSSVWQSASLVTQSQSANNSSVYTNVNGNSANWNSSYTTVNSNSASWLNSGSGDANVNSFVYSQSANILSTITTVQVNSASWGTGGVPQILSFNENNAELTISSGNTVSLSSLSGGGTGGGGSGVSIQGNIAYNRWQFIGSPPISSFNIIGSQSEIEESFRVTVDSVIQDPFNYTVSGNFITFSESPLLSSNIVVVETYVVPDESPLVVHQYQRWFHTGNGSTSAFDISGAFLTDRFAYRVTVDYLLQDPLSYTIDLGQSSLLFSESPPLSSEIVIVEQYHTSLTATVSSFTTPVTASGDFLIVRVNNVDRAIRLWDF